MKKNVFLISFLFPLYIFAQPGYKFGIHLQANGTRSALSYLSFAHGDFSLKPGLGYGGGMMFHYGIQKDYYKNISIRTGILFFHKENFVKFSDLYIHDFSKKISSASLEFPLLISMRTPIGNRVFLRGSAGFGFNYNFINDDEYSFADSSFSDTSQIAYFTLNYNAHLFKQFTVAIKGIGELEFENPFGTRILSLGVIFSKGLMHDLVGQMNYSVRHKYFSKPEESQNFTHYFEFNGSYLGVFVNYFFNPRDCCPFLDGKKKSKKPKRERKKDFMKSSPSKM